MNSEAAVASRHPKAAQESGTVNSDAAKNRSMAAERMEALSKFASLLGTGSLSPNHNSGGGVLVGSNKANPSGFPPGSAAAKAASQQPSSSSSHVELSRCLYRNEADPTGGALCSLPCLELHADNDEEGDVIPASGLLPSVGHSRGSSPQEMDKSPFSLSNANAAGVAAAATTTTASASSLHPQPQQSLSSSGLPTLQIPKMAASVVEGLNGSAAPSAHTSPNDAAASAPATAASTPSNGGMDAAAAEANMSTAMNPAPDASNASTAATSSSSQKNDATDTAKVEKAAARNLGRRTTWTRSSISQAPPSMLRSLSTSFSYLVDLRVKAWTLLLLRHSLSSGDDASRARLLALLSTSSSISLSAIVTQFSALSLGDKDAKALAQEQGRGEFSATSSQDDETTAVASGSTMETKNGEVDGSSKNPDAILPLIFEAMVDVSLQGEPVTVKLRAPGTIAANFASPTTNKGAAVGQPLMTSVELNLDTTALVSSMIEQVRLVVFKAVAKVTSLPSSRSGGGLPAVVATNPRSPREAAAAALRQPLKSPTATTTLSQYSSSLSLAQVARVTEIMGNDEGGNAGLSNNNVPFTSAVALNGESMAPPPPRRGLSTLLRGGGISRNGPSELTSNNDLRGLAGSGRSSNTLKKQRSVTWNHPIEEPKTTTTIATSSTEAAAIPFPTPKRRKLTSPASIMKTKSFGKPDSSLCFSSIRNATFNEFGRTHKNSHVPTFVDGRLVVPGAAAGGGGGAPSSAQLGTRPNGTESISGASTSSSNSNATFHILLKRGQNSRLNAGSSMDSINSSDSLQGPALSRQNNSSSSSSSRHSMMEASLLDRLRRGRNGNGASGLFGQTMGNGSRGNLSKTGGNPGSAAMANAAFPNPGGLLQSHNHNKRTLSAAMGSSNAMLQRSPTVLETMLLSATGTTSRRWNATATPSHSP